MPERETALEQFGHAVAEWMRDNGLFRSCLNCEHWVQGPPREPIEQCGLYKARPPARIIVSGCDSHSDNIPF